MFLWGEKVEGERCMSAEGLSVKGSSQQSWTSGPQLLGGGPLFSGLGPLIMGGWLVNDSIPATHKMGVFIAKKWREIVHGGVWCHPCFPLMVTWVFCGTRLDLWSNHVSPVSKEIWPQPTLCYWTGVKGPLCPKWYHPLDELASAKT